MDQTRFEQMVARLERESAQSPGLYQIKVALLALLGFGILALILSFAGAGLLIIAGASLAVLLSGGKALILLFKLGKLLLILAIPLWMLVKSSLSALFTRLPAPQGLALRRAQAPALFDAMDDMRRRMKGPRFHHVLITDEVNAAVLQRPLFGLFGWPRNYLILGLPLLESLSPEEALAVVAHEYGHLAGSHSRFAAYIYRLRNTWGTIQGLASQWQGWFGKPLQRIVAWYAPYFNAYTFVLARTNEYQADAASAELVGANAAASALKRVNVAAAQYDAFMERTFKGMADTESPPSDLSARWASQAIQPVPPEQAGQWLRQALNRQPQVDDTHPALSQRLQALPGAGAITEPPTDLQGPSAALIWLGAHVEALRKSLQTAWHQRVAEPWSQQHQAVQAQRQRLVELEALATPNQDERIETLELRGQLHPDQDHLPGLIAFNADNADHVLGLYLEGSQRLKLGDEEGLCLMDRVMTLDPDAIKPACELAHGFCKEHLDDARAQVYAERWRERDTWQRTKDQQLSTLDVNHELRPATEGDMDAALRAHGIDILRREGAGVKCAYLVRRVLPVDPSQPTYVVALELTWWARRRNKQASTVNRIAAHEWPGHVFICTLDGQYKPLKHKLKKLTHVAIFPNR